MPLLECIENAKSANKKYTPPTTSIEKLDIDNIRYLAIHELLKNNVLVYCMIVICKQNTLLKNLVKSSLKEFIQKYEV